MAQWFRANLLLVHQSLKKVTVNQVNDFQVYHSKPNWKKKLRWLLANGFQTETSTFKYRREKVSILLEECKQKEIHVASFTKKIEYINKHSENAKRKSNGTLDKLQKGYDE